MLWLQYTRSGNRFNLVLPGSRNVVTPGWYALHIVEDGTPSKSIWIRVGGDPVNLYQWPQNPSFSLTELGSSVNW